MYQANLSFRVLQKYLAEITDAGMICFEDETQCYGLTPKGQEFLQAYKKYSKMNQYVMKRLGDVSAKRKILEHLCSTSQTNM
jgi:hypothetical protein